MTKKATGLLMILSIGTLYFLIYNTIDKTDKLGMILDMFNVLLTFVFLVLLIENLIEVITSKLSTDEDDLINRAKRSPEASAMVLVSKSIRILGYAILAGCVTIALH